MDDSIQLRNAAHKTTFGSQGRTGLARIPISLPEHTSQKASEPLL